MLFSGVVTAPSLFGGPPTTTELKQFACSSTLIAPDVVLLAAHCVDPAVLSQGGSVEDLEFRWSRQVDLTEPDSPSDAWPDDAIRAVATVFPDEWAIDNMQDFSLGVPKYDIALMFLEEAVQGVAPAVLVDAETAQAIAPGVVVDVVGWGFNEPIGIMESFMPPSPDAFGRKMWGTTRLDAVGDFEIQVGDEASATRKCRGDSGGPTFMEVSDDTVETYRLIGVTSRAADFTLCETMGGYDTRVDAYLDWIDEELRAACDDGTRVWCDEPGIIGPTEVADEKPGGCHLAALSPGTWIWLWLPWGAMRRRRSLSGASRRCS
jgi:hypothetical protein